MHGGLADRLKGVLTTYYLSRRHSRPFYIFWTEPFLLEDYLLPNEVDWRIDSRLILYSKQTSFPAFMDSDRRQSKWMERSKKWIFKSWFYGKKDLHVYTNYGLYKEAFPILFKELFKPSEILRKELLKYELACNGGKYWSFTFRFMQLLGDFKERGEILPEDKRDELINKNINELKTILTMLPRNYKALITSDSKTFLNKVDKLDERIFFVEGNVIHPNYTTSDKEKPGAFLKSFVDFYLIMGAEKVFRFKTGKMYTSGFPKLAALLGEKEYVDHRF